MRKFLFFMLALLAWGSGAKAQDSWANHVAAAYDGGDGNSESPYLIASAEQLARMAARVNDGTGTGKSYVLTADIDASAYEWVPIGNGSNTFKGTLDGRGHTVTYKVTNGTGAYLGLFGCLSTEFSVKHLRVAGSLSSSSSDNSPTYVGGIAGQNNGTIEDCYSSVNVTASGSSAQLYVGGIAGYNTHTIKYCAVSGTVSGPGTNTGSIVGANSEQGTADNCMETTPDTPTEAQKTQAGQAYQDGYVVYAAGIDASRLPPSTLSITLNSIDKTNYFATFYTSYANYEVSEGITIYSGTVTNSGTTLELELRPLDGNVIPSCEAVILAGTTSSGTLTRTELAASHVSGINNLKGIDAEISTPEDAPVYVLGVIGDEVGFHLYTGTELPANKAYLQVQDGEALAAMRFSFGGQTTAISQPVSASAPSKTFYTLQGQRIDESQLQKGQIYIVYSDSGKGTKYIKR